MMALTIHQPWAWAIAAGHKRVENRNWTRRYRGPLAIHASVRWDADGEHVVPGLVLPPKWWTEPGVLPRGAFVAVAELVDVCAETVNTMRRAPLGEVWCGCGPWAVPGLYHWKLTGVRALDAPVPCRGAQGLWSVPDEVRRLLAVEPAP